GGEEEQRREEEASRRRGPNGEEGSCGQPHYVRWMPQYLLAPSALRPWCLRALENFTRNFLRRSDFRMAIGTSQLLRSARSLRTGLLRVPSLHRALSTLPRLPLFEALLSHDPNSIAIRHVESGKSFTYRDLLQQTLLMK